MHFNKKKVKRSKVAVVAVRSQPKSASKRMMLSN